MRFASEHGFLKALPRRRFDTDYVEVAPGASGVAVHRVGTGPLLGPAGMSRPARRGPPAGRQQRTRSCCWAGRVVATHRVADRRSRSRCGTRHTGPRRRRRRWPATSAATSTSCATTNRPNRRRRSVGSSCPAVTSMSPRPISSPATTAETRHERRLRTDQRRPRLPADSTAPSRCSRSSPNRPAPRTCRTSSSSPDSSPSRPTRHATGGSPPGCVTPGSRSARRSTSSTSSSNQPSTASSSTTSPPCGSSTPAGRSCSSASPAAARRTSPSPSPRSPSRPGSAATSPTPRRWSPTSPKPPGRATLASKLKTYTAPSVLVIDDVGLLPMERGAASAFYQVVNQRYEKQHSTIVTTNRWLPDWGEIFGDAVVAVRDLGPAHAQRRRVQHQGPVLAATRAPSPHHRSHRPHQTDAAANLTRPGRTPAPATATFADHRTRLSLIANRPGQAAPLRVVGAFHRRRHTVEGVGVAQVVQAQRRAAVGAAGRA